MKISRLIPLLVAAALIGSPALASTGGSSGGSSGSGHSGGGSGSHGGSSGHGGVQAHSAMHAMAARGAGHGHHFHGGHGGNRRGFNRGEANTIWSTCQPGAVQYLQHREYCGAPTKVPLDGRAR